MKRLALIMMLCAFAGAHAEQAQKSRSSLLRTWFKHLKEGLAESSVAGQYQKTKVTAVAAVRGAQQNTVEPDRPQWKTGKPKKAEQLKKERAELASAVDLILEGKLKEGSESLDAFEKAHPKSSLIPEVQEAREKMKELEAAPAEPPAKTP